MNIILTMEFVEVASSQIRKIGYSEKDRVLAVEFKNNRALYYYKDVSKVIYEKLINAKSVGKYFEIFIRDEYEYEKMN